MAAAGKLGEVTTGKQRPLAFEGELTRFHNLAEAGGDRHRARQPARCRFRLDWNWLENALGVPRGFEIPKKTIPSDKAELEAEHAMVTKQVLEAFKAMQTLPPGQERESQAFAMVAYRERRWLLSFAIRNNDTAEP